MTLIDYDSMIIMIYQGYNPWKSVVKKDHKVSRGLIPRVKVVSASPQGAAGAAYGLLFVIILNVQFLLLPRRGNIIGVPGMC